MLQIIALSLILSAGSGQGLPVQHGDRVVFLGDSITAQRLYTTFLEAYFTGRLPHYELTFVNAGRLLMRHAVVR